jgi:hypothetical protein
MKEQRSPAVKHINVNLNIGLLHSFEGCATLLGRTPRATQSKTSRGGVDVDPLAASVAPFLIGRRHHRRLDLRPEALKRHPPVLAPAQQLRQPRDIGRNAPRLVVVNTFACRASSSFSRL